MEPTVTGDLHKTWILRASRTLNPTVPLPQGPLSIQDGGVGYMEGLQSAGVGRAAVRGLEKKKKATILQGLGYACLEPVAL